MIAQVHRTLNTPSVPGVSSLPEAQNNERGQPSVISTPPCWGRGFPRGFIKCFLILFCFRILKSTFFFLSGPPNFHTSSGSTLVLDTGLHCLPDKELAVGGRRQQRVTEPVASEIERDFKPQTSASPAIASVPKPGLKGWRLRLREEERVRRESCL